MIYQIIFIDQTDAVFDDISKVYLYDLIILDTLLVLQSFLVQELRLYQL